MRPGRGGEEQTAPSPSSYVPSLPFPPPGAVTGAAPLLHRQDSSRLPIYSPAPCGGQLGDSRFQAQEPGRPRPARVAISAESPRAPAPARHVQRGSARSARGKRGPHAALPLRAA